jgi:ABC-type dipeptide/oligopeptide/nickel transport system ATPase component
VSGLGWATHHPYTMLLLSAAGLRSSRERARTDPPDGRGSRGCPFHGPCPFGQPTCASVRPILTGTAAHRIACPVVTS